MAQEEEEVAAAREEKGIGVEIRVVRDHMDIEVEAKAKVVEHIGRGMTLSPKRPSIPMINLCVVVQVSTQTTTKAHDRKGRCSGSETSHCSCLVLAI